MTPLREVADAATSPERLRALALSNPELHSLIAVHPNADPELLDWLSVHGTEGTRAIVSEIVSQRLKATAPDLSHAQLTVESTTVRRQGAGDGTPRTRSRLLAILAVFGGLALTVIVSTSIINSGKTAEADKAAAAKAEFCEPVESSTAVGYFVDYAYDERMPALAPPEDMQWPTFEEVNSQLGDLRSLVSALQPTTAGHEDAGSGSEWGVRVMRVQELESAIESWDRTEASHTVDKLTDLGMAAFNLKGTCLTESEQ